MEFDQNRPIYMQIYQKLLHQIARGERKPGEQLPSVRELSMSYGVNPNTLSRALSKLDEEGLSHTERTSGRFITRDEQRIKQLRMQLLEQYVSRFFEDVQRLGLSHEEAIQSITRLERRRP